MNCEDMSAFKSSTANPKQSSLTGCHINNDGKTSRHEKKTAALSVLEQRTRQQHKRCHTREWRDDPSLTIRETF